jgi:uncharacterized protein
VDDKATLGGLTPDAWDRLAAGHLYSSSAWLRLCNAEYGPTGGAVVCWQDGEVESAVPTAEMAELSSWSRYGWNNVLADAGLPLLPKRGMLVGPREGFRTHLLGAAGRNSPGAVRRLLDGIRREHAAGGDTAGRACVAMYLTTADVLALRQAGVDTEPVLLDVDAWLEVPDGGWPAYLASLSTSKRRRSVVNDERKFQAAGYRVQRKPLSECYEQLGGLAVGTLAKYGHQTDAEQETTSLRRHAEIMGPAAQVTVCSVGDGDPVGFCLHYAWGDTIHIRWVGFDYDRLVGAAEYFNITFYPQIRLAVQAGQRWIQLGVSAPDTKAFRGAQLWPVWMLDLAEDSALARAGGEVRAHNERLYGGLVQDARTRSALVAEKLWDPTGG